MFLWEVWTREKLERIDGDILVKKNINQQEMPQTQQRVKIVVKKSNTIEWLIRKKCYDISWNCFRQYLLSTE